MSAFRVIAIPTKTAQAVRETLASPFAEHPVHREVARGHGPCRHCLQNFRIGEENRLLLTYDPFAPLGAPPLPGPVFIHDVPCERYAEDAGVPGNLSDQSLTLNAYGHPRELVAREYCLGSELEAIAGRILDRSDVDFIHVRDTDAGCYDFRLERFASC